MTNQSEHYKYFEILTAKPTGFFRKENVEEKVKCFDFFKTHGGPSDLWFISAFLKEKNSVLREKAAETILHLFKKLKSHEELSDGLKHIPITISDLKQFSELFPAETYFELLCIASFNGNGYVRELAVTLLSRSNNPTTIKYLLLRAADWVPQVRETAIEYVRHYFQPSYRDKFIHELPLVEWLLSVRRVDLSGLYAQIIDFITSESLSIEYIKAIAMPEKSMFLLFSHQLKKQGLTPELLNLILSNRSFLIRMLLFKYIPALPTEEQQKVLAKLLRDRSAKIRIAALSATKPLRKYFRAEIFSVLSDESASARDLARRLLKEEAIDYALLYRNNLQTGNKLAGNLMGLADIASAVDLPVFEKFISDDSIKIQLTCLVAINRLDSLVAKNHALDLLFSPSKKVRAKCCEILAKNYDEKVLEKARSIYQSGNPEQRKTILILLSKIGGWKVVADLIISLLDENHAISDMAWTFLLKWKIKAVNTFTSPAPKDIERANEAYKRIAGSGIPMTYYRQKLWEELPFFLS